MDTIRDFEYFSSLFEDHLPGGGSHDADAWDKRADDWAMLLSKQEPGSMKQGTSERVTKVAEYLRAQGLLGSDCDIVDIGCGPGRFVAEFAKTARSATGLDISPRMLEHAKNYAESIGLTNTVWQVSDFKTANPHDLGVFDLVFTSITPAVSDISSLEKSMLMSRGYCFNSSFIHSFDELEDSIAKVEFPDRVNGPVWSGRWFYSLFNVLWLMGYYPITSYHDVISEAYDEVDDELIRYFTREFSSTGDENDKAARDKVESYLLKNQTKEKTIKRRTENRYGWTLWDVRVKEDRRIREGK
jgi:SAM-dependent methyltransferase